jgi:ankyrin repeat protein
MAVAQDSSGSVVGGDLFTLAKEGDTEKVRALISQGVDVNSSNANGETPLHAASVKNNQPIVMLLLQAGANPNTATINGWTPLHSAARFGADNALSTLIQNGGDVNAINSAGQTPEALARAVGNIRTASMLKYYTR